MVELFPLFFIQSVQCLLNVSMIFCHNLDKQYDILSYFDVILLRFVTFKQCKFPPFYIFECWTTQRGLNRGKFKYAFCHPCAKYFPYRSPTRANTSKLKSFRNEAAKTSASTVCSHPSVLYSSVPPASASQNHIFPQPIAIPLPPRDTQCV